MSAQTTTELLDQTVSKNQMTAIQDLSSLLEAEELSVEAFTQAALLVMEDEEGEVTYRGTYADLIRDGEANVDDYGKKAERARKSATVIPRSTKVLWDNGEQAKFKLRFDLINALDVPLYGIEPGIEISLEDGTDGYGSTGVDDKFVFLDDPIPVGGKREGLTLYIVLDHDEEPAEEESIYGMDAIIRNLKTLDVKYWDLPIYDCRTKEGWMVFDRGDE